MTYGASRIKAAEKSLNYFSTTSSFDISKCMIETNE
jgi:hypothetical protein